MQRLRTKQKSPSWQVRLGAWKALVSETCPALPLVFYVLRFRCSHNPCLARPCASDRNHHLPALKVGTRGPSATLVSAQGPDDDFFAIFFAILAVVHAVVARGLPGDAARRSTYNLAALKFVTRGHSGAPYATLASALEDEGPDDSYQSYVHFFAILAVVHVIVARGLPGDAAMPPWLLEQLGAVSAKFRPSSGPMDRCSKVARRSVYNLAALKFGTRGHSGAPCATLASALEDEALD